MVTPAEAAAKALRRIEHPYTRDTVWDSLDEPTRAWCTNRMGPVADAALAADKET